jgi:hypothetical protein
MNHFTSGGYPNPDPYYISPEEEQRVIDRENEVKEMRRAEFIGFVQNMRREHGCKEVSDEVISQAFDMIENAFRDWPKVRAAAHPECNPLQHIFWAQGESCMCGAVPWGQPSNTVVCTADEVTGER